MIVRKEENNMRRWNPNGKLRKIVISNVKYYREKSNMSQEELSLKLKRKSDFIKRLEENKTRVEPTVILIDEIADVLNISTQYLITERNNDNEL